MLAKCQMLCYSIQVGKRKMLSIRKYGRLVKGLRRRPLTAETGVRFPYLLLNTQEQIVPEFFCYGLLPVERIGVSPNGILIANQTNSMANTKWM